MIVDLIFYDLKKLKSLAFNFQQNNELSLITTKPALKSFNSNQSMAQTKTTTSSTSFTTNCILIKKLFNDSNKRQDFRFYFEH